MKPNRSLPPSYPAALGPVLLVVAALLSGGLPAFGTDEPARSQEASASSVFLEERVVDLGVVPRAERATAVFSIRNEGEEEVSVTEVTAGPGLEVPDFDRVIPPGESRELEVIFDASKINGTVKLPVEIWVEGFAEPLNPVVAAKVEIYLAASPSRERWIYVQGEQRGAIEHLVWPVDGAEFEITRVDSPHPDIDVSFRPAREDEKDAERPGPQWMLEATLDPWARVGPITGLLEVHTTHPVQERLLIPVSGFVRPILVATPQKGAIQADGIDEPLERNFHVQAFSTDPVTIREVKLEPAASGFETRVEVLQPGHEYLVWLRVLPEAPESLYRGVINVHTDDDRVPVLEIPVQVEVL